MKRILSALRISVALCLASLGERANAADTVSTASNRVSQVQGDSAIENTFRRALIEEESSQNLAAAIKDYQEVVARLDARREMQATAIFRLGECYRKQRLTNEAVAQYERILRDFSEQLSLVTLSHQDLVALGSTPSTPLAPALSDAARQGQKRLLAEEIALVEKKLANEQKQLEIGRLDQEAHLATQRELLRLKRQLAALGEEPAARQEQKRLLEEEIGLVETKLAIRQKQIEVGAAAPEALWETQRELLELKRQQFALDTGLPALNAATAAATDEEQKEIRRIQEMVRNSPDLINAPGADGLTPLHKAAQRGQLLVAQFLLDHGADVNRQDRSGSGPLHLAAANGHKAMVELLLSRGATVDARDKAGWTPLCHVAGGGFKAVAETLLAHKADVNARASDGRTPLHRAADAGMTELVELLLSKGADVNAKSSYDSTPLILAVAGKHLVMTKLLLANKAEVNTACNGQYGGTGVNTRGYYPLHFAAAAGDNEMLRLLLDSGAKPNVQVKQSDNTLGPTPLILAVQKNFKEATDTLLQYKADPNIPDEQGKTALFYALGDSEMLKRLLDAGAKVDLKDPKGETPLHLAMSGKLKDAAELLLARGPDVNARNEYGNTPLHMAVWAGSKDLVELLLVHKADPNIRNRDGTTPLDSSKRIVPERLEKPGKIAALLRQHGALEWVPRPDEITVTRRSAGVVRPVFSQGTNLINRFTLLEFIAALPWAPPRFFGDPDATVVPFPDSSKVTITRRDPKTGKLTDIPVDVAALAASEDSSRDVPLDWGDLVDIPDREHKLNESWRGLPADFAWSLAKCLDRNVTVIVKGQAQTVKLAPTYGGGPITDRPGFSPDGTIYPIGLPFRLKHALTGSARLLSTSDLTRVKVRRVDPATGQTREWVFNEQTIDSTNDLWLRDGDVIEVPEKE